MRFEKTITFLVAACVTTVASAAEPTSPLITKAKTIIAARMADPASLQYRKLRIAKATIQGISFTVACGEYNAKNKFGGYTGFEIFAYEATQLEGVLTFSGAKFDYLGADGSDLTALKGKAEFGANIMASCLA